jgi:tripartite-type tricarboxylate transporter receptor subunit TctC
MSETLPGFLSIAWFGIVAPPKTPASIAERFAAAVGDGLKEPEAVRRMNEMSAESLGTSPAHMGTFMKQEAERWRNVIRVANVKLE